VGKDSGQFISPVLHSGLTLGTPNVKILSNVNYKSRITKLALSDLIKDATCDFDATGTIDQTELWLAVKKLEVNLQLCKNDYYEDFIGENTGAWGPLNNGAFLRYMMAQIGGNIADAMETMVWQGVDGAGEFDGFETLLGAPDVTATPTASTIIADMRATSAAANINAIGKSDFYYYLSAQNYNYFMQATNDKYAAARACGEGCVQLDGIQVKLSPGMAATSIVAAQQSNLFYGTWMNSDQNRVSIIDQEPLDGSDNMNIVMKWFGGTAIGYRTEIGYSSAS
jgi:hypothetical protein